MTSVGGCPVPSSLVTGAGAIEVAVHGWDVAVACGQQRPLPEQLAEGAAWVLPPARVASGPTGPVRRARGGVAVVDGR
ncbi:MAG: hypothetical protein M3O94_10385 [Actinomycetota bacterium]|nr:hypothetical protein [Actinomycetota bacterium]